MNDNIINNEENYLSTTMIARNHGIEKPKEFIEYLQTISIILRDENNQLLLSNEALKLGAIYKTSESGTWIVWPEDVLKPYLEAFVKSSNTKSQIPPDLAHKTIINPLSKGFYFLFRHYKAYKV